MYVFMINNRVTQIIPEFDPIFPDIPISKRYSEDFCKKLIQVDDSEDVKLGMYYDKDDNKFYFPKVEYTLSASDNTNGLKTLEELKSNKITESKIKLAEWLETHPMAYSDGNSYSVTAEKQSLLNSNLASYERAKTVNVEYPLKWNSTGSECTPWDYTDLLTLSLTIAGYVAPKVSKQQAIELQIKACTTLDELNEIVIDYDE